MKDNIKSIKSLPDYEKVVYDFDKKGKRFEKKVKVKDNYLVTMRDGSSVCLTKEQLSYYNVSCTLPNSEKVEPLVQNFNNDLINEEEEDEEIDNNITEITISSPNI